MKNISLATGRPSLYLFVIALSFRALDAAGQAAVPGPTERMVVTGDREAPLVLYIVPWQDPKPLRVPDVDMPPVIPRVFDTDIETASDRASSRLDPAKLPKE